MRRLMIVLLFVGVLAFPAQADASLAGCRTVDVARVGRSPLGFVVYKFHHVKRWCWRYPRITHKSAYTYVSDVDAHTMRYDGLVAATGFYYWWCCGTASSGHFSLRQARFSNCLWKVGCWRVDYPWVRIWVHADGTYTARTGV